MKNLKYLLIIATLFFGCKKSAFLDAKPEERLIVPESLKDMDAILDNEIVMNGISPSQGGMPNFGEIASDDHFVHQRFFANFSLEYINLYKWDDNIYNPIPQYLGWSFAYRIVFYSNAVLDGLEKINLNSENETDYYRIKGTALFHRAHSFYQIAQIFASPYSGASATQQPGIPLRLTSDANEPIKRASVEDTYRRIVEDLTQAISLLPNVSSYKSRPSKAVAYGLLARVYLAMQKYEEALTNSDNCLKIYNELLDYNTMDSTSVNPFSPENKEIMFMCNFVEEAVVLYATRARVIVDTVLYSRYKSNDLRRALFFRREAANGTKAYSFKGTYGTPYLFCGLATDEIYLIRAECRARLNQVQAAMNDLNHLMSKRWRKTVPFPVFTASDSNSALRQILEERRKELLYRGLRWTDLRRFNLEGANISVTRVVNGQAIVLEPNSLKYTFLIPPDVMQANPGMQQNAR